MDKKLISIYTERFFLKPLRSEDVSTNYLSWFLDSDTKKFIQYAGQTAIELPSLQNYVEEKWDKENCLLLGIFEKEHLFHIGNIKFEPIDMDKHEAVMGILIGDKAWRGKKVAQEVISHSAHYLKTNFNLRIIQLNVHKDNKMALAAYAKMGFQEQATNLLTPDSPENVMMSLQLT